MRRVLAAGILGSSLFVLAGCGSGMPNWPVAVDPSNGADALLDKAVQAQGGDAYELLNDVAVSYEGEWGQMIQRIQPVVTNTAFRLRSEERYHLASERMAQVHRGPEGVKTVVRDPAAVDVRFMNQLDDPAPRGATDEENAAAAMVADAYTLFLLGPSFVRHRSVETRSLGGETVDGRRYDRLQARLRPGFGFSEEDWVVLWLDPETHRLFRVQMTLEGVDSTRGAEVDITFSDHREVGGFLWPTRFVERVRAPIKIFAHRWTVIGLDVDRGLAPADLDFPQGASEAARRPASVLAVQSQHTASSPAR